MPRKKPIDPIPEEFASYEEAAEFWDTHDTTDYPDAFRTVVGAVRCMDINAKPVMAWCRNRR